jgi:hypothetical protein
MTAIEKLQQAKSLIDEAMLLIEGEYVPPPPPPPANWPVALHSLANEAGYLQNPALVKNGSEILCFYRKGTSHLATGVGKIMLKKSTDNGVTWSAEQVFFELTNKDCRGIIAGKNPDTGLLIVCFHSASTSGVIEKDWILTSIDGDTWSTREFTEVYALGNHHGFGGIVKTANGLMLTYYWFNRIYGLFSTDGGLTWGSPVTIYSGGGSSTLVEPWVVRIDDNRLVCICRDNQDGGRYFAQKSSDGGLTWAVPITARWTSTAMGSSAAPVSAVVHGNDVYFGWDGREPFGKQYLKICDKEAFWADPRIGWQTGNGALPIYNSKIVNGSAGGGEFGYITMLDLPLGVLRVFYDSKTGNGTTETEILVGSL